MIHLRVDLLSPFLVFAELVNHIYQLVVSELEKISSLELVLVKNIIEVVRTDILSLSYQTPSEDILKILLLFTVGI